MGDGGHRAGQGRGAHSSDRGARLGGRGGAPEQEGTKAIEGGERGNRRGIVGRVHGPPLRKPRATAHRVARAPESAPFNGEARSRLRTYRHLRYAEARKTLRTSQRARPGFRGLRTAPMGPEAWHAGSIDGGMARKTPPAVKAARIKHHDAKWAFFDAWDAACARAEGLDVEAMNAYCAADADCINLKRLMELAKAEFVAARKAAKC